MASSMVDALQSISRHVLNQQRSSESNVYTEFEDLVSGVSLPQTSNIHPDFIGEYRNYCNIIAFGILRLGQLKKGDFGKRVKKTLDIPSDVDVLLKKSLGVSNKGISECMSILGVNYNIVNFDDCKDEFSTYDKLANLFDTVGSLYNFTPQSISKMDAHKVEVNALYDRLLQVVERNDITSPYGVMYYRGGQGYFLRPASSNNGTAFYPLKLNYFADPQRGIVPSAVEEEHKISQLFVNYVDTAEPGEFIFYDRGSQVSASLPSAGKPRYYPIFIASLVFKRKMHCSGDSWYLDSESLSKSAYLNWLFSFFHNRLIPAIMGAIPDNDFQNVWLTIMQTLTAFVYLEDYQGVAKATLVYSFGKKNDETSLLCQQISENILDTRDGCFGSTLFPGKTLELIAQKFLCQSSQDYSGYVISFTADKRSYYALTCFAYHTYEQMLQNGKDISLKSLFIGKNSDDTLCYMDLSGNLQHSVYITAGSRSGKGVLTLNILGALIYCGCPLIYLDNKPDMSSMLWQMERELNKGVPDIVDGKANPNYKRILAIEGLAPNFKFPMDSNNVLGFNSTRVRLAFNKALSRCPEGLSDIDDNAKAFIAYAKAVQLSYMVAQFPLHFGVSQSSKFTTIMDELNNANNSLGKWIRASGVKYDKTSKLFDISKLKNEAKSKVLGLFNDMANGWSLGKNAWFTTISGALYIEIAQKLSAGGNTRGGDKEETSSFIASMIMSAPYKIFGKNGNMKRGEDKADITAFVVGNDPGRMQAYKEVQHGSEATDKVTGVQLTANGLCSRRFIFSIDENNYTVFAPLFTLNRNDLLLATEGIAKQTIGGTPPVIDDRLISRVSTSQRWAKSNVGPFLDIQESNNNNPEDVIRSEIVVKNPDGSYDLNQKIGFLGLLRMLLNNDDNKILSTLSRGYDILWGMIVDSGIAEQMGYTFLEEYLYDLRPESIFTLSELTNRLGLGKDGSTNSSSEDAPINVGDFDNSSFEGYADGNSSTSDFDNSDNYEDTENMGDTSDFGDTEDYGDTEDSGNMNEQDDWGSDNDEPISNPMHNPTPNPMSNTMSNTTPNTSQPMPNPINSSQSTPIPTPPDYSDVPTYDKPFVPLDLDLDFNSNGAYGDYTSVRHYSEILCECIRDALGDINRVTKFEVEQGGRIVVNGVLIAPSITSRQLEALPLDIRGRVAQGMWIDVFHFADLYKFKNLAILSVDDIELAYTKLRTEIGKPTFDGVKKKLSRKTGLQTLIIAGQVIDESPESQQQQQINEQSHTFTESCKRGFGKIAGVGSALKGLCGRIHASRAWQGVPGKIARGAATVAGVGVGMTVLSGLLGLFGVWGTLNVALMGAGGIYNAVRKRK